MIVSETSTSGAHSDKEVVYDREGDTYVTLESSRVIDAENEDNVARVHIGIRE